MADYFTEPSFNAWITQNVTNWATSPNSAVDQSANIHMISRTQLSTFTTGFTPTDFTKLFSYKYGASDSSGQYYNYIT